MSRGVEWMRLVVGFGETSLGGGIVKVRSETHSPFGRDPQSRESAFPASADHGETKECGTSPLIRGFHHAE
jgi:hypothetical protein